MAAANLVDAASDSFNDCYALWLANTLKAKLALFANGLLPTFPQQQLNAHPVSNWLTLILVASTRMPSSNVGYSDFLAAVDYMYRCCWMTNQLGVTQSLITSAQAAAVLASYNATIA